MARLCGRSCDFLRLAEQEWHRFFRLAEQEYIEELKHRLEAGSEVDIADTLSRLEQFPMTQAAMLETGPH